MPAIPWSTALFMFRKLMPVVIDQAPEILKSFERRRTAPPPQTAGSDQLLLLQERLETQSRILTTQAEALIRLQGTLATIRRSLWIAWAAIGVMALLAVGLLITLLLRA